MLGEPNTNEAIQASHCANITGKSTRGGKDRAAHPEADAALECIDDDREANEYTSKYIGAMNDNVYVPICYWFTNSNITRAKFKVDKAAKITHFSSYFIANIGVVGIFMVGRDNLGNGLHHKLIFANDQLYHKQK